jgi:hypothetical protein
MFAICSPTITSNPKRGSQSAVETAGVGGRTTKRHDLCRMKAGHHGKPRKDSSQGRTALLFLKACQELIFSHVRLARAAGHRRSLRDGWFARVLRKKELAIKLIELRGYVGLYGTGHESNTDSVI